jgi:hypothetical protein
VTARCSAIVVGACRPPDSRPRASAGGSAGTSGLDWMAARQCGRREHRSFIGCGWRVGALSGWSAYRGECGRSGGHIASNNEDIRGALAPGTRIDGWRPSAAQAGTLQLFAGGDRHCQASSSTPPPESSSSRVIPACISSRRASRWKATAASTRSFGHVQVMRTTGDQPVALRGDFNGDLPGHLLHHRHRRILPSKRHSVDGAWPVSGSVPASTLARRQPLESCST